jgi:hypothetical protein
MTYEESDPVKIFSPVFQLESARSSENPRARVRQTRNTSVRRRA